MMWIKISFYSTRFFVKKRQKARFALLKLKMQTKKYNLLEYRILLMFGYLKGHEERHRGETFWICKWTIVLFKQKNLPSFLVSLQVKHSGFNYETFLHWPSRSCKCSLDLFCMFVCLLLEVAGFLSCVCLSVSLSEQTTHPPALLLQHGQAPSLLPPPPHHLSSLMTANNHNNPIHTTSYK